MPRIPELRHGAYVFACQIGVAANCTLRGYGCVKRGAPGAPKELRLYQKGVSKGPPSAGLVELCAIIPRSLFAQPQRDEEAAWEVR